MANTIAAMGTKPYQPEFVTAPPYSPEFAIAFLMRSRLEDGVKIYSVFKKES